MVQIENVTSSFESIKFGVPQGSILGPLLFIVFINDIVFEAKYSTFYMNADDANLSCYNSDVNVIQTNLEYDMHQIQRWRVNNKMVINTSKSKSMLVCSIQKRAHLPKTTLDVTVYGEMLETVCNQKILGLIIDNNLNWKPHIDHIHSELYKLIGLLWRNWQVLHFSSKLLFYNSYILPKIDYCLPIWGSASKYMLDKIWRIQKRAIRIICNVSYDTPTAELFKNLNFFNIFTILDL